MDVMLNMIDQIELPELPLKQRSRIPQCKIILCDELRSLAQKVRLHPDVYGVSLEETRRKSLLDALYEEGIIPTYSFPKDVVSTFIENEDGQIDQQVERGLDIAISEYAPGRSIVVNKETYVIGGIYCHTDNPKYGRQASDYLQDPNYVKKIVQCGSCDWFGFPDDTENGKCPFCHSNSMIEQRDMLRPWGFSPMNGRPVSATMVDDVYSYSESIRLFPKKKICSLLIFIQSFLMRSVRINALFSQIVDVRIKVLQFAVTVARLSQGMMGKHWQG